MSSRFYTHKADLLGSAASTMCLLHCIATPFIFLVQANNMSCGKVGPWWWQALDFLFLFIGFIAIYRSNQTTSLERMPKLMYGSWFVLSLFVVNSKESLFTLPIAILYLPAIALVGLHLYNLNHQRNKINL